MTENHYLEQQYLLSSSASLSRQEKPLHTCRSLHNSRFTEIQCIKIHLLKQYCPYQCYAPSPVWAEEGHYRGN